MQSRIFEVSLPSELTLHILYTMLRKIRIWLAAICFTGVTLLFLDFTGTIHAWLGWLAKIQLLPALLALNFGVVAAMVLLTLVLGRVYCSVICPLGVMQDIMAWCGRKAKKNRYKYSPAKTWLRVTMLVLFVAAMVAGFTSAAALIAPYSAYGRIAQNLFAPVWQAGNNLLAYAAERMDSYAFYPVDVWIKGIGTFAVAVATFAVLWVLAWRNGRTWCNTICPVGTVLGFISKWSLLRPVIDTSKCNGCGKCARNCKSACIDSKRHEIDYTRCVVCMDCLGKCKQGAIIFEPRHVTRAIERAERIAAERAAAGDSEPAGKDGMTRRKFLSLTALLTVAAAAKAQEKTVDGGLAIIEDKKIPDRKTPVLPAGAQSLRHFSQHCTGCQLCVSVCPNGVLRPSQRMDSLMQPEMSFERGYCRPECTRCSEVCPTGAIRRTDRADKSSTQTGHAVWVRENCVPLTAGDSCGNCSRHCPSGAITMVSSDPESTLAPLIPAVNTELCIGCGACENLCPARPFSAIYVEGHEVHRTI